MRKIFILILSILFMVSFVNAAEYYNSPSDISYTGTFTTNPVSYSYDNDINTYAVNEIADGSKGCQVETANIQINYTLIKPNQYINWTFKLNSDGNPNLNDETWVAYYNGSTWNKCTLSDFSGAKTFSCIIRSNNNYNPIRVSTFDRSPSCVSIGDGIIDGFYESYFNVTSLPFIENSQVYNNLTYDTKNEFFQINVTASSSQYSFIGSKFNYDGVSYNVDEQISGDLISLSKRIDMPIVNTTKNNSFYWTIGLTDKDSGLTFNSNTSQINQTVNASFIAICNGTYPTLGMNITMYNETSMNPINTSLKATFSWYLGSGSIIKNNTFNLATNSSFRFCIYPNQTFIVKSNMLAESNSMYGRVFDFKDILSNNSVAHKKLYLIGVEGTRIILSFKDTSLVGLSNYYMQISRYYSELNQYVPIHQSLTDNFGQVVSQLVEDNVKYIFKFYDANNTLVQTSDGVSIACRSTICTLDFVKTDSVNDFERFKNISNYDYSLVFNNDTNLFIYTWNDNTGNLPFHRLLVEKVSFNGTSIICNSSSTAITGSLTCSVGSTVSTYRVQAFRHASPERRIALMNIKVGDINQDNIEGLLWSFVLLMTMIGLNVWYPPLGIVFYVVGVIFLGTIGILYVSPAIMIAQIVIGVLFWWAFKS